MTLVFEMAGVVQGLQCHAAGERAVADDGHNVVLLAGQVAGKRDAESRRDGRARMAGAEGVVWALLG